ncbi:hypothetical protein [Methyloglobulus sp.]|uniref:CIS tube protein n=1 Tax=Methyloglobulus sp. TaxID=2518622 RepID=UPI0032B8456E
MSKLEKAYIVEINDATKPDEISPHFEVQFNPTSLKLQISTTKVDPTKGSQVRQSLGSGTTILTLELVFDTSDEGTTDNPRSVREKTKQVERFTLPKNPNEVDGKPPRLRFQWGSFFIDGVVDGVNVDLDHFATNGTPLRAKVNLSIKGQDANLQFAKGNQQSNAPSPLGAAAGSFGISGGVGISGGIGISGGLGISAGVNAQVGVALGGESLPEFSARAGLDPAAWRGLSTDISGGLNGDLSLQAGAEVGFNAGLNASAGIGVTLGVEAGVSASLEASFGLEANAGISAVAGIGVGAELAAGFSLSAGGGLNAALETVRIVNSQTAVQKTRQAFATSQVATVTTTTTAPPSPRALTKPALPDQSRPRLTISGLPSLSRQQVTASAPLPPRSDTRSTSFGFGVPLRPIISEATMRRADSLSGSVSLRQQIGDGLPPASNNPTVSPWIALPNRDHVSIDNKRMQKKFPCGCLGRCHHVGGR